MKTVSRINTAWLIIVTYRTEWEPRFDTEIIDFATWYVMNTGVLCASLGSRVIAGARLLSLAPSCSLLRKINDSFVQFSEIRVRQAYSHLRYLKLYRNRTCEVSCNRFSHLFIVGPALNNSWSSQGEEFQGVKFYAPLLRMHKLVTWQTQRTILLACTRVNTTCCIMWGLLFLL